jgi:bacterioferritin-associated ferredoxin
MYVCLCMGVSDREIRRAIRDGACSTPEVMACTGAGTRCGSCRPSIVELVKEAAGEGPDDAAHSGRRSLEDLVRASTAA